MSEFKRYTRRAYAELRPYIVGEVLADISVSNFDKKNGSPKAGDYIARNPQDHSDQWLVSAAYFAANHFTVVS